MIAVRCVAAEPADSTTTVRVRGDSAGRVPTTVVLGDCGKREAGMMGVNGMTEEQKAALELAKSMLADAEQYRFAHAPIPLAPLRALILLVERANPDVP